MSNIKVSSEEIEKAKRYYIEISKPFIDAMKVAISNSSVQYILVDGELFSELSEKEYILEIKEILFSLKIDIDVKLEKGYFR